MYPHRQLQFPDDNDATKNNSLSEDITEILLSPLAEFITNVILSGIRIVLFENEFPHSVRDKKKYI
jgi:hypothetical protein